MATKTLRSRLSSSTLRSLPAAAVLALLSACTAQLEAGDSDQPPDQGLQHRSVSAVAGAPSFTPPGELVSRDLEESSEIIVNPDRGFYASVNLLNPGSWSGLRSAGHTLVIAVVRLDDYRDQALSSGFLADLQAGFAAARAAGIKIILRFAYNASFSADAPLSRVLQHIDQLAPAIEANADVISVVQAGFIGAWGEWHGSTNGLDNTAARSSVLGALLAAVPTNRFIQLRTPMFKDDEFPGGPLSDEEAFSGTAKARVGHHNDCFLASSSDEGTYESPVQDWKDYVALETRNTPMGGETCGVSAPRSDCPVALEEMARLHWSYVNSEYHQQVLSGWENQGCYDDMERLLGYRLVVKRVSHTEQPVIGGRLAVELELTNRGFAAPYNERPVYLVLSGAGQTQVAKLGGVDPRRWYTGDHVVQANLTVPSTLSAGTYALALWMPDADEGLQEDPRYAIRLANSGGWDQSSGHNVLIDDLVIAAR